MAGVIQDLGLIEKIDARLSLESNKGGIVRYGQCVAVMILNGLGFMNKWLHMAVRQHKDCLGRFILATNQCDMSVLSNEALLS